jgi:pyruvate/2-oxoglutarate dehydrogenase complex dihydrolipoamide acyltransferase (E2) component
MGGSGGGGNPPPQNDTAMLAMIAQMQRQAEAAAAAARRAQEEAVYNSQVQAANQAGAQGSQEALQQLGLLNQTQQAADAAKLSEQQKASSGAGYSATGGAYDLNAAKKAQLQNLGAATGALPKTMANVFATDPMTKNPADMTASGLPKTANTSVTSANQFALPSTQGLTFGGQ